MIIDTHSHYNLPPLYQDWHRHWQEAQAHDVVGALVIGTNLKTSRAAITISENESQLWPAVGIHPTMAGEFLKSSLELEKTIAELGKLANQDDVVAIGECGLDYFRLPKAGEARDAEIALQQQLCRAQLQLAGELQLPVSIHLRDKTSLAYHDFLEMYQEIDPQVPTILHCVSGPTDWVLTMLEHGAFVSVAGNVSYPSAEHVRGLVAIIPPDRLLIETDAPYLPPKAYRGESCLPWMISETMTFLEQFLDKNREDIYQNTISIFPQCEKVLE
ncbi:MAG: TatD family hydrolase [Patescibacteria group bacterium]